MLHMHDGFPPVIAGLTQQIPLIGDDLVQGILDQTGEIGGGGKLDAFALIATMQVIIAGEHQVQLPDAGQPGGFHFSQTLIPFYAE